MAAFETVSNMFRKFQNSNKILKWFRKANPVMATKSELTVTGYIRELQKKLEIDIPDDIWLIVVMFYPNYIEFEGNTMNLTRREKEIITSWFIDIFDLNRQKSVTLTSELLYNYNKHGKEGCNFQEKCDGNINTFSIIQTQFNGHIFGCFTSKEIKQKDELRYHRDDKAFLCVIRPCFKDKKAEIFKVKKDKMSDAYFHAASVDWGPAS